MILPGDLSSEPVLDADGSGTVDLNDLIKVLQVQAVYPDAAVVPPPSWHKIKLQDAPAILRHIAEPDN